MALSCVSSSGAFLLSFYACRVQRKTFPCSLIMLMLHWRSNHQLIRSAPQPQNTVGSNLVSFHFDNSIRVSTAANRLDCVRHTRVFCIMGFIVADRAWFWCASCVLLNATTYISLPIRLGDNNVRLEFAQRLTSALHAIWMFIGAVDCWARGEFALTNGADALQGRLSIAEFCPSIDARLDHMLGYLISDQVNHSKISSM